MPGKDATLLILGRILYAAYAARMRTVAAQFPDADIRFRGAVLDLFESERIDALIDSSQHEAHSVTLLEAAACWIPSCATSTSPIEGAIGGNCRAFAVGDPAALEAALVETARDWPGSLVRAELAVAYAPSIHDAAVQYLSLFEQLVDARARRAAWSTSNRDALRRRRLPDRRGHGASPLELSAVLLTGSLVTVPVWVERGALGAAVVLAATISLTGRRVVDEPPCHRDRDGAPSCRPG